MQLESSINSRHDTTRAGPGPFQLQAFALPLGISRASFIRALELIFDGQATSLDLSIGNFDLPGIGTIFEA
jgi:hypothetical protein